MPGTPPDPRPDHYRGRPVSNIPETGRTQRVQIRLIIIQVLVFSLLLTLGGRLWYLQIRNGQEYTDEAKNNHVQQVVQPASAAPSSTRGECPSPTTRPASSSPPTAPI